MMKYQIKGLLINVSIIEYKNVIVMSIKVQFVISQ